jgi:hypothetical protein
MFFIDFERRKRSTHRYYTGISDDAYRRWPLSSGA